jgi:anti-anti-sigma factor
MEKEMEIELFTFKDYSGLKLSGRLDTITSADLETVINGILDKGTVDIIIDFTNLTYICSSGLRVFLVAAKKLDLKGKKINFCGMRDYIKEVFDIAGFTPLFSFFNVCEEVV